MDISMNEIIKSDVIHHYLTNSLEKISKTFAAQFREGYGLTTKQLSTLWYLNYYGAMTMSEYADKMFISRQQATQMINIMVEKGMIVREHSETNRREIYIRLTEKGTGIVNEVSQRYNDRIYQEVNKLTEEQQIRFARAMNDMNELLDLMDFYPKDSE